MGDRFDAEDIAEGARSRSHSNQPHRCSMTISRLGPPVNLVSFYQELL